LGFIWGTERPVRLSRFAVISDVHANLEALEQVLLNIEGLDVYCLGDLVDYGANPNEVIEALQRRGAKTLMGNHDSAVLSGDTSMFNARAAMSSKWSGSHLSAESLAYLRSRPSDIRARVEGVEFYFTHGSPDDRLWEYVDPRTHSDLFGHYLDKTKVGVIGLGHTHIPYVWKGGGRAVFNPGSVGQPRDGDRRASFAIVSVSGKEASIEVVRAEYDFEKAGAKIREAGLPVSFADRLKTGS
jgi:putative phosphoesterase